MRKIVASIVIGIGGIWWLLNFLGTLQTARDVFQNRGVVMNAIGVAFGSQWLPLGLFILGLGALYLIQFGVPEWLTFGRVESCPGLSLHMSIRVSHLPADRRKYIFDFGKLDAERLSIYVSPDNIFTLCFTDAKREPHLIQTPLGGKGFPIGSFQYLVCELGVSGQSTSLGMLLDGHEVGVLNLPFKTDIGVLDVPNGVIGADLSGSNGAAFDLSEIAIYGRTIVGDESRKICEYFRNQLSDKYVEFSGNQWMRVSDGPTRDAHQQDLSKAPKFRTVNPKQP